MDALAAAVFHRRRQADGTLAKAIAQAVGGL
jgi:hypothetical protein